MRVTPSPPPTAILSLPLSDAPRHAAPDGACSTLHVRCGSDIIGTLRSAGFAGDFLEYSDPICQGPVPGVRDLAKTRAAFIAAAYDRDEAETLTRLRAQDRGLRRASDYERVALWFEHDPYDQLLLARILARFARGKRPWRTDLILVDDFPNGNGRDAPNAHRPRFIGLGQLAPDALRLAWDARSPVDEARIRLGRRVWSALRDPCPSALHAIASGGTSPIPPMACALSRHLQELPWTDNGLGLTQRLTLEILAEGAATVGALFSTMLREREPLPFLGDVMYWDAIRSLITSDAAAVTIDPDTATLHWPERRLRLTDAGRALMSGNDDWLRRRPPRRWVGGVPIGAGDPPWRWDPDGTRPILRA